MKIYKAEFVEHMSKLLECMPDPYIGSNLRIALDRYESGAGPPPPPKPRSQAEPGYCIHAISLNDTCDKCAESYGRWHGGLR